MSQQGSRSDGEDRYSRIVRSDLVRPRYSPGLILEDSDLTAAVDYTRELNRLLFRSLLGGGIVAGLEVSVERDDAGLNVAIAAGLALDGWGDPVQLASEAAIELDSSDGVIPERGGAPPTRRNFWVVLSGAEERSQMRELVRDGDDFDGLSQATRIRATAKVSILFDRPAGICAWDPAAPDFQGKDPVDL